MTWSRRHSVSPPRSALVSRSAFSPASGHRRARSRSTLARGGAAALGRARIGRSRRYPRRRGVSEVPLRASLTAIEFYPAAESELLAAARYYEEQAENLGLDFLAAVEATCKRILQFGDIGRPFGDRLRRVLVPRFPYGVICRKEDNRTFIIAVANLYRSPGSWRSRT